MENKQSILKHNAYEQKLAKTYSVKMMLNPSPLEDRMANYFNVRGIEYVTQKPFFITDKNGKIIKFFIADFYIPNAKLIVEVDGKFHKNEQEYDNLRDELIKEQYKGTTIVRLTWHDLDDQNYLNRIFQKIQFIPNQSYIHKKINALNAQDEYIMFFIPNYKKLLELTGTELKLLFFCWFHSSKYNEGIVAGNIIYNDSTLKEKCHKAGLKATGSVIDNTFSKLHRKGFLLKICRGEYMINPLYAFRGSLKERNKLLTKLLKEGKIEYPNTTKLA